jgi:Domain of unknown function (DUF4259)
MGTWGTGPFSSDGALDLLDGLAGQRREALERLFSRVLDHPDLMGQEFFPDQVVAAAAFVAAGLPGGGALRHDLAGEGYDVDAITVPAPDPGLTHSAREALLVAAGRNGAWHNGWVDSQTAAQARQTTDRLASILLRQEH